MTLISAAKPTAQPALNHPRLYRGRPIDVHALSYDGSADGAAAVSGWVDRTSQGRVQVSRCGPSCVLVLEQPGQPGLSLGPGQTLVYDGHEWSACDTAHFRVRFELRPRELPIFDDGELSS